MQVSALVITEDPGGHEADPFSPMAKPVERGWMGTYGNEYTDHDRKGTSLYVSASRFDDVNSTGMGAATTAVGTWKMDMPP